MKKVVILGGGFAGSLIAKKLEKELDVTLIDTKDYFEFTPSVLRTIVEAEHIKKIQILHENYLKKAKVIKGKVSEISKNYVKLKGKKFKFDYLAVCSGSGYSSPFKEQNIIIATRATTLRNYHDKLSKSKNIIIIGGGLVGVELAGEILSKYKDKLITIVHSGEKLIERNHERAIMYADKFLRDKGVKIVLKEKVISNEKGICITDKKTCINADMIFLCTGIVPNFEFMKKNYNKCLNEKNQIKVNEYLQLFGEKNIFVAGDVNDLKVEKTAQNAEKQGWAVVRNIMRMEKEMDLIKFEAKKTPLVISLGKYKGIFDNGKFVWGGIIPALMKQHIENWAMLKKRMF